MGVGTAVSMRRDPSTPDHHGHLKYWNARSNIRGELDLPEREVLASPLIPVAEKYSYMISAVEICFRTRQLKSI